MKEMVRRAAVVTVLAIMVTAWPLAAITTCAQFITSAADDAPNYGWLSGESTVSTTTSYKYSGTWSFMNFGGTFDGSSTTTTTYSVGTYTMADGTIQTLRCDSYTPV
jgi:hypothetical protein